MIIFQDLSYLKKCLSIQKKFGAEFQFAEILNIENNEKEKVIHTTNGIFKSKAIIIATGTEARLLGIPGEKEFASKGVSYCAVCDGAFFKNKNVVVIGGGDSAVEEALYLSNIVNKVTVVHRRDELRAQKILQDRAFSKTNIEFVWDSVPFSIEGERKVSSINVKNVKTNEILNIKADGIFIYIGMNPQTKSFENLIILKSSKKL